MGCRCSERRAILHSVVEATRRGDALGVRQHLQAMGKSLAADAAELMPNRKLPYRIKPEVAKDYGLDRKSDG